MNEAATIVGVVGAGTMGAGIAQIALEAAHEVVLHDVDETAIERGRARVRDGLERRAAKLGLDPDSIDEWVDGRLSRLRDSPSVAAVADEAGLVIEAALEDLALKQTIFRALDSAASGDTILATNTSALPVGAIAAATETPERVIGLHFFNPAPVMPLVELVTTPATDGAVAAAGQALVESWGKTAVRSADTPGFIVNRVNRPFTIEALRIVESSEATIEAVDGAMVAAGYPMGPFALMDLIGVDVNLAVAVAIWEGLGRPDRLRPSPLQEELVAAGRLGRKSGDGFHAGGRPPAAEPRPDAAIADRITYAILNEAWHALGDGVASKADIDIAVRLGAGHPEGPFERTARLGGPAAVADRLRELAARFGPRFEPAVTLNG
jgi:3-hydroxybutyryl-CoA dehydrogenase